MLTKRITFTDWNGQSRTQDFHFHLSKSELMEMKYSVNGGFDEYMKRIIETQDSRVIMQTMKDIILSAYGEKDIDGRRFRKSEEIKRSFYESPAYDELLNELLTGSDDAISEFINGIMPFTPAELEAAKNEAKKNGTLPFPEA